MIVVPDASVILKWYWKNKTDRAPEAGSIRVMHDRV